MLIAGVDSDDRNHYLFIYSNIFFSIASYDLLVGIVTIGVSPFKLHLQRSAENTHLVNIIVFIFFVIIGCQ